jgi:hypothetical protein
MVFREERRFIWIVVRGVIQSKKVLIGNEGPLRDHSTTVCNLVMQNAPHNYFVGGALVHNGEDDCGCECCGNCCDDCDDGGECGGAK